jgi:hypothetical protein
MLPGTVRGPPIPFLALFWFKIEAIFVAAEVDVGVFTDTVQSIAFQGRPPDPDD